MKITKPQENQLLIEDENLINFKLKVSSKTGLNESEYNNLYEGLILAYRQPNMDASKQMFMGSIVSIATLYASLTENIIRNNLLSEKELKYLIKEAIKASNNK